MPLVTVKSKTERFRRAGIEFTRAGVEIDIGDLTPEQALAIASEPQLTFLVDGEVVDRPSAEQIADMRAEIERRAAEKAEAEKAAAEEAAAKEAEAEKAAAEEAATREAAAAKDKKADKKSAK